MDFAALNSNPELRSETGPVLHYSQTRDIDEQAALLKGWGQSYAQMSSGAFSGAITEARFADLHLFVEETGAALYQTGVLPDEFYAIGVPLRSPGDATFCGAHCDDHTLHVFSGKDGFDFQSPSGLVMAGVVVPRQLLSEAFQEDERNAILPELSGAHLRRGAADTTPAFRQFLAGVFDVLRDEPDIAENSAAAGHLTAAILSNLAQALGNDARVEDTLIPPGKRWQIVSAARRLALDSPERPITVAELCQTLDVSRRTLQYCFQDIVGHSPAEFLRIVRLNGARHAIKTSRSVTEAATYWGFWHLGRFSHDYRALFGELPSETFRRAHAAGCGH